MSKVKIRPHFSFLSHFSFHDPGYSAPGAATNLIVDFATAGSPVPPPSFAS
jgi:hypothetical protein